MTDPMAIALIGPSGFGVREIRSLKTFTFIAGRPLTWLKVAIPQRLMLQPTAVTNCM